MYNHAHDHPCLLDVRFYESTFNWSCRYPCVLIAWALTPIYFSFDLCYCFIVYLNLKLEESIVSEQKILPSKKIAVSNLSDKAAEIFNEVEENCVFILGLQCLNCSLKMILVKQHVFLRELYINECPFRNSVLNCIIYDTTTKLIK